MSKELNRGYSVEIVDSAGELTAKERIMLKDTSNTISLDEVLTSAENNEIRIKPTGWVQLKIHNEQAENKDYNVFVVVTDNAKYSTSSESFADTFIDLFNDCVELEEEWAISIYHKPSKNFKGKNFITCSLV